MANDDGSFVKRVHFNRLKTNFGDFSCKNDRPHSDTRTDHQELPAGLYYTVYPVHNRTNVLQSRSDNMSSNNRYVSRTQRSKRRHAFYPDDDPCVL